MNNFLELHSSADYRNTNRPYYTGTWEYVAVASDYLIPFQWTNSASSDVTIYSLDTAGVPTDRTDYFRASNPINDWTESGGTFSNSFGLINSWATDGLNQYIVSSAFTLTAGKAVRIGIEVGDYDTPANYTFSLRSTSLGVIYSDTLDNWDAVGGQSTYKYVEITTTAADYYLRITAATIGSTVTANAPTAQSTSIHKSTTGNYQWYDGSVLLDTWPSEITRLKVMGSSNLYSDWLDTCGFDDKLKFSVSSSYDYGGINYHDGFEQWIYKDASVRRNPSAEIEITAEQRNGVRIDEKKISAVRYKTKMKVTESEYEAFVHAAMGTVVITDYTGKSYTCTSIEMTEPTWYRGNGILELSFIDENNINIWTRNNSDL